MIGYPLHSGPLPALKSLPQIILLANGPVCLPGRSLALVHPGFRLRLFMTDPETTPRDDPMAIPIGSQKEIQCAVTPITAPAAVPKPMPIGTVTAM
jgi:hypothetical protein